MGNGEVIWIFSKYSSAEPDTGNGQGLTNLYRITKEEQDEAGWLSQSSFRTKGTTSPTPAEFVAEAKYMGTIDFYPEIDETTFVRYIVGADISTDGTEKTYTGKTSETLASNQFKSDGNATVTALSLKDCIEHASGHAGKLTVALSTTSTSNDTLTITQATKGIDGN